MGEVRDDGAFAVVGVSKRGVNGNYMKVMKRELKVQSAVNAYLGVNWSTETIQQIWNRNYVTIILSV